VQHVGVQTIGQCDGCFGDTRLKTGGDDLAVEIIAVASVSATSLWQLNFPDL
jgi:hypothetical protein